MPLNNINVCSALWIDKVICVILILQLSPPVVLKSFVTHCSISCLGLFTGELSYLMHFLLFCVILICCN